MLGIRVQATEMMACSEGHGIRILFMPYTLAFWCVSLLVYKGSPMAYVAKFYGILRLIRSAFESTKISIKILILWVYYTIHFCLFLWAFQSLIKICLT